MDGGKEVEFGAKRWRCQLFCDTKMENDGVWDWTEKLKDWIFNGLEWTRTCGDNDIGEANVFCVRSKRSESLGSWWKSEQSDFGEREEERAVVCVASVSRGVERGQYGQLTSPYWLCRKLDQSKEGMQSSPNGASAFLLFLTTRLVCSLINEQYNLNLLPHVGGEDFIQAMTPSSFGSWSNIHAVVNWTWRRLRTLTIWGWARVTLDNNRFVLVLKQRHDVVER